MALIIIESCVNCWACIDVCPSQAIYKASPHFKINPNKCSECADDYSSPQCGSICPIEGAILLADGAEVNPLGSLTGIPPEQMLKVMQEIQQR